MKEFVSIGIVMAGLAFLFYVKLIIKNVFNEVRWRTLIKKKKKNSSTFLAEHKEPPSLQYVDPAMIGVLVGMALMFIIICVVLRLFSK